MPTDAPQGTRSLHSWVSESWSGNYGGPKAKRDIIQVLRRHYRVSASPISGNETTLFSSVDGADLVLVQHPTRGLTAPMRGNIGDCFDRFIEGWARLTCRKVIVIHDIKSLQALAFTSNAADLQPGEWMRREALLLEHATDIVTHTMEMQVALERIHHVRSGSFLHLGLFDYLTHDYPAKAVAPCRPCKVAFCGYLAGRLYEELCDLLPRCPELSYVVFSPTRGAAVPRIREDVRVLDEVPAERLPAAIRDSGATFGLAWWSEAVLHSGYLGIIAPHKASCYLAAGIPLIAPADSYIGRFVEENGLGVCIGALHNLPEAVLGLSSADLRRMSETTQSYSVLVRAGHFTTKTLRELP